MTSCRRTLSRALVGVAIVAVMGLGGTAPAAAAPTGLPPELSGIGQVIDVPKVPQPPTVNPCSLGPSGKRLVCYEHVPDAWGNSQLRVCVYSEALGYVMPWYNGMLLGCVSTSEWSFVPATGVCVTTIAGDPTLCANNNAAYDHDGDPETPPRRESCFLWTPFFRVCDDPDV